MSDDKDSFYRFPNCMHALSAAMHRENIAPEGIVISLPFEQWWRLYCVLEAKFQNMAFRPLAKGQVVDGQQKEIREFTFMGFTFRAEGAAK